MHLASWAQAELPLAADLIAGRDDVRPGAGQLLERALAVLPAQVCGRPGSGLTPATSTPRWRTPPSSWAVTSRSPRNATRRPGGPLPLSRTISGARPGGCPAQVAACDYAPAGWPPGTYTIIRRVKVPVDQLSADPRSRRRRTVDKDQLALALDGAADWTVPAFVDEI